MPSLCEMCLYDAKGRRSRSALVRLILNSIIWYSSVVNEHKDK